MDYPTLEQVAAADHEQICRWWRFLKRPENHQQGAIIAAILDRYNHFGDCPLELSKKIGWAE